MSDSTATTTQTAPPTLDVFEQEHLLPHALEVERELLGLSIRDAHLRLQTLAMCKREDFFAPAYRDAIDAMTILVGRNEEVTAITLSEVMREKGTLESVGGYPGLVAITQTESKTIKSVFQLAKILRDRSTKRELYKIAKLIATECLAPDAVSTDVLASLDSHLARITEQARTSKTVKTMKEVAEETLVEMNRWREGKQTALKTGIPEWDRYLVYGGFSQGDLIYIAAQSSFGKTAMAWQIIRNVARAGHKCLFFSAEMEAMKLMLRAMQGQASKFTTDRQGFQFTPYALKFAQDKEQAWHLAQLVLEELEDLPIYIDDTTRSWTQMKAKAREMKSSEDIEFIVGDYIQLADNTLGKGVSREREVGKISTDSKTLAKELDVPFCWLSQLSRQSAKDKRDPELHDLRDSGQLEQDADVVVFLYGDGPAEESTRRVVKSKFAKQRNGPVGKRFDMDFETDKQLFLTQGLLELMTIETNLATSEKREPEQVQQTTEEQPAVGKKLDEIDDIPF